MNFKSENGIPIVGRVEKNAKVVVVRLVAAVSVMEEGVMVKRSDEFVLLVIFQIEILMDAVVIVVVLAVPVVFPRIRASVVNANAQMIHLVPEQVVPVKVVVRIGSQQLAQLRSRLERLDDCGSKSAALPVIVLSPGRRRISVVDGIRFKR